MSKFWYNMMFVNRMITFFTSRYRPRFWSGILLVFYYTSHYKRSAFLGGGRRVVHWIVTDFSCRRDDPRPAQDARSRSSATHGGQRENSFIKLTDTMSLTEPVRDTGLSCHWTTVILITTSTPTPKWRPDTAQGPSVHQTPHRNLQYTQCLLPTGWQTFYVIYTGL